MPSCFRFVVKVSGLIEQKVGLQYILGQNSLVFPLNQIVPAKDQSICTWPDVRIV